MPLTPKPEEYKFMLNESQLSQRQLITPNILTPVEPSDEAMLTIKKLLSKIPQNRNQKTRLDKTNFINGDASRQSRAAIQHAAQRAKFSCNKLAISLKNIEQSKANSKSPIRGPQSLESIEIPGIANSGGKNMINKRYVPIQSINSIEKKAE